MRLYSLNGNSQKLDGGAMFGNVPKALWQKWVTVDDHNRIDLACRCLLIKNLAGKTVLFETGIGAFFDPKLKDRYGVVENNHVLLDSLHKIGLENKDIDVIVLSHLHFDHAGGLLSKYQENTEPMLLFPNAKILVSKAAWERANNPHPRDKASFIPQLNQLLIDSNRLEIVEDAVSHSLNGTVAFTFSNGHTPGLMLAEIAEQIIFCADLIPGIPWVHLPITMGYDRYPEVLIDEKKQFLEDKLTRNVKLFFTHDTKCAMADVTKNEKGKFHTINEMAVVNNYEIQ